MATKSFRRVLSLVALLASFASAQSIITLCGTVTNAAGSPVSGASVKLQTKNIAAVSGSDGRYCINWSAGVSLRQENIAPARACALAGKRLMVTLVKGDNFRADLFDIRGRTLWAAAEPVLNAGPHEIVLPLDRFSPQTGLLRVEIGASKYSFRFAGCGQGSFAFSQVKTPGARQTLAKITAIAGTLPILDTLVATGQGSAMNNKIRSYVYTFVDTIDFALGEPDSFSEARQQIVHRVNDYRATLGLKRLTRNKAMDACVDTQAQMDYASGVAHSAFGHCKESAQDECPGWTGSNMLLVANTIVISCMQMMWDEGAPPAGTPCGGGTVCYSQHGHYINMTDTAYSKMACGFYYNVAAKSMCATQDFFR
jgi:hypothetical protein